METRGARHVAPGEGERWWVVGDTYTLKAVGRETGGSLGLMEAHVPVGGGPPPHVHLNEDEFFYILEGELEMLDGDRVFTAGPGSFTFVPRGTKHRFLNRGTAPARALIGFTPGNFMEFFRAVGQPAVAGREAPPLGPEEIARTVELAPRFGMQLLLPENPDREPAGAATS